MRAPSPAPVDCQSALLPPAADLRYCAHHGIAGPFPRIRRRGFADRSRLALARRQYAAWCTAA
ncbi:MAG TPA: hypothetical protein DIW45_11590, partial [Erythrobacter sp.]|nr:hypothetical protein [Erythrobacter sp.]